MIVEQVVLYNNLSYQALQVGKTEYGNTGNFTNNVFIDDLFASAFGYRFPVQEGNIYKVNYSAFSDKTMGFLGALLNDPLSGDFYNDIIDISGDMGTEIVEEMVCVAPKTGYINLLFAFLTNIYEIKSQTDETNALFYSVKVDEIAPEPFSFVEMTLPFAEHL
jgi:hypothetical protein